MEEHEKGDDDGQDARQNVRRHDKVADFVIERVGMCQCAANNRITRRNDNKACHAAMEEHIHEEFVVVETDAVCNPWAVMVHLENASVALGAVVAPVRLSLVAPLANADAAVALTLDRGLHAQNGLALGVTAGAGLLVVPLTVWRADEGAFSSRDVLEVFVDDLTRFLFALLDELVGEGLVAALLTSCLLFLLLVLGRSADQGAGLLTA